MSKRKFSEFIGDNFAELKQRPESRSSTRSPKLQIAQCIDDVEGHLAKKVCRRNQHNALIAKHARIRGQSAAVECVNNSVTELSCLCSMISDEAPPRPMWFQIGPFSG